MRDRPLYGISTVAELLDVHPETLRVWERHQLLKPSRRKGHRCYTDADVQRLLFIRHLMDRWGLNLAGVHAYVRLYPCWPNDCCPSLRRTKGEGLHAKPCWRQPDSFCTSLRLESEPCRSCDGRSVERASHSRAATSTGSTAVAGEREAQEETDRQPGAARPRPACELALRQS